MLWKIFARESGEGAREFARECFQEHVIAVGWNPIGDLNSIESREKLHHKLAVKCGKWADNGANSISQWTGSLWAFRTAVKSGHSLVCPDRISGQFYVGVIRSRLYHDDSLLGGTCNFSHRRRVKWLRELNTRQLTKIWPSGQFGGRQTVSQIHEGEDRLLALLERKRRGFASGNHLPTQPDKEWGRAAEERALAWLAERGDKPIDEAHLNLGWDISCGESKFEVKGRKSRHTTIRLTQNEWSAATRFREKYTVLLFTASNKRALARAEPEQLANPAANPEWWERRAVYEYLLVNKG
jgi:hypothetical protein